MIDTRALCETFRGSFIGNIWGVPLGRYNNDSTSLSNHSHHITYQQLIIAFYYPFLPIGINQYGQVNSSPSLINPKHII